MQNEYSFEWIHGRYCEPLSHGVILVQPRDPPYGVNGKPEPVHTRILFRALLLERKLAGSREPLIHSVPKPRSSRLRIDRLVDPALVERWISSELPFFASVEVRVV